MQIETGERPAQLHPLYRGWRWRLGLVIASILLHGMFGGAAFVVPGWLSLLKPPQEQPIPVEIVTVEPPPEPEPEPQPRQRRFLDRATNYAERPKAENPDQVPSRPDEKDEGPDVVAEFDPGIGARAALEKKKAEAIVASNTREDGDQVGGRLGALLRAQIGPCWAHYAQSWARVKDIEQLRVYIEAELYTDGTLKLEPEVFAKDGVTVRNEVVADVVANGARDAIRACAPYRFPPDIYKDWKALKLVFLLDRGYN